MATKGDASHVVVDIPQSRHYESVTFPLCLSPHKGASHQNGSMLEKSPSAVIQWAQDNREYINRLLSQSGVLLFRGFAASVSTPEDFSRFVEEGLGLDNFPYVGGNAVRTAVVGERVFTANESPPDKPIPFHHELAQTPVYPGKLLFYCEHPAETGGETPILLSTVVYKQLLGSHPQFVRKLEEHGVIYSRVMTAHDRPESAIGRGWRTTFKASCRREAEEVLQQRGYSWNWIGEGEDALLREVSPALDAVKTTANGEKAFFNQIVAVWGGWRDEFNTPEQCLRAGDGSALDPEALHAAAAIMRENAVAIPWQRGDILYIDNMQAQHSRNTYSGKRRVLASLAK